MTGRRVHRLRSPSPSSDNGSGGAVKRSTGEGASQHVLLLSVCSSNFGSASLVLHSSTSVNSRNTSRLQLESPRRLRGVLCSIGFEPSASFSGERHRLDEADWVGMA
jgi:hypothetical protein